MRRDHTSLTPVKALVTGGAGFIGSNLVHALLETGHNVRVLDNFSTGSRSNLATVRGDVEIVEGDLRSYERVHNAVRGTEVVFHQGALPSVPRSLQDPLTTSAVNVEGTLNVLLAARDESVRRVVTASSSSVYGSSGSLPRVESAPVDPIAPYAVAKLAAERYCVSFARVYDDLDAVCLRYFNVFGPRQDPESQYAAVVPRFITGILRGDRIPINGDGEQSRDFTYVANVVAANIDAARADGVSGRVFNIATGHPVTVNAIAETIGRIADMPVIREQFPPRAGDVRDSWASIDEAKAALGWEPAIDLEQGLVHTIDSFAGAIPAQPH
jgi:nucleoside-diphosphate-sugar epimerase